MLKARQGKEVVVRTENKIGALADFSRITAERGINTLAVSAWVEGGLAVVRLVTDDTLRTTDALRENGYAFEEIDVVLVDVDNKPGILRHVTDTLSWEEIDLSHLFASAMIDQEQCLVVLNSSDNERAIVLLNR